MANIEIRTIHDGDIAAVAEIVNRVEAPWRTTEEEVRQEDRDILDRGGVVKHYVAVAEGTVAGHGALRGAQAAEHRQDYALELRVHPDWRHRGVGGALWRLLERDLGRLFPTSVRIWVREKYPEALLFAERRGFTEVSRSGLWSLDVAAADLLPFDAIVQRVTASGVELTTLADVRAGDPDWAAKLHALRVAVDADIPSVAPYPVVNLEDFVREMEYAGGERVFIARRGGEYAGLTCLHPGSGDPTELSQSITGVRRDCRHQGIAIALKVLGIRYAHAHGYARIVTYVDTINTPMAGLNRKLGFAGGNDAVLLERTYNAL